MLVQKLIRFKNWLRNQEEKRIGYKVLGFWK
jgi:hypothetical protein